MTLLLFVSSEKVMIQFQKRRDVTYSAVFEKSINQYTVTWNNPDGTPYEMDILDYGTIPSIDIAIPDGYSTLYWHDGNHTYLDGELPELTQNITYTAEFFNIKPLRVGTVFYTGDEVYFDNRYFISNPMMNRSDNLGGVQTIGNIAYNSFFGQYTVREGFFPMLAVKSSDIMALSVCIR